MREVAAECFDSLSCVPCVLVRRDSRGEEEYGEEEEEEEDSMDISRS
jgi:hypothetical protein